MRKLTVVLGAAILLVLGGVASASIPSADGTIHGCYKTSNPAKGAVIVIDTEAGGVCPSGYAVLDWPGHKPLITMVVSGNKLDGSVQRFEVSCPPLEPEPREATSAHVWARDDSASDGMTVDPALRYSYRPVLTETGQYTGYRFAIQGTPGQLIEFGITCLTVDAPFG